MEPEQQVRFGIHLETDVCEKPWAYAADMLQRVSRTFALNIQVLPGRLRRPILLAYLFCRMADTLEDDPHMNAPEKRVLLDQFAAIFTAPSTSIWHERAQNFVQSLPTSWHNSSDDNHFLCIHLKWTLSLYFGFEERIRAPIVRCVTEMCSGMATFAERQQLQSGTWLTISSEADLDNYCYYVAGVVGDMLCDLFYAQSPWISKNRHMRMRELSVSFGLGLQVTNIVKDIGEDSERQVCFIPQDWMQAQGITNASVLFSEQISLQQKSKVAHRLAIKAWKHLEDAMNFTLLIPATEPRIRLFCLWPLFMATETLVAVGDGSAVFGPKKVKISRDAVKRIIRSTTLRCWSNSWIRKRFRSQFPAVSIFGA